MTELSITESEPPLQDTPPKGGVSLSDKQNLSGSDALPGASGSNLAIAPSGGRLSDDVVRLLEEAGQDVEDTTPPNTARAYGGDLKRFEGWCADQGVQSMPALPQVVAAYAKKLVEDGKRISTVERALAAISTAHRLRGHEPSPTTAKAVRVVMKAQRRLVSTLQRQASPVVVEHLQRLVEVLPPTTAGKRDKAIILLGFAGAYRRSELVSLDVEDIDEVPEGIRVLLRRSKTDQEGQGVWVAVPFGVNAQLCPVRALRAWLEAAGVHTGAIFRQVDKHDRAREQRLSAQSVALVVKRAAKSAGYDPSRYSGHSLRSGLATAAATAGHSERVIMKQTRHRSVTQVRKYIRDGEAFTENALLWLL